jgi:Bifunctional DNA primase/polymerase, N-terminal/AAA domain
MSTIAQWASDYAHFGIPVLPLWGIADGRCTCGKDCGRDAGKHPCGALAEHGVDDASADPDQVARWYRSYPDGHLNIGLAMGVLVAIDEDQAGAIQAAGLELPAGPVVRTARGHHYYFRPNGAALQNGKFGPGKLLECKTTGGYVTAPPSRHISGIEYTWLPGRSIADLEIPILPDAIGQMIVAAHDDKPKRRKRDIFDRLDVEQKFHEAEAAETTDDRAAWREAMVCIIGSLVAQGLRDDLIVSFCRRATWRAAGWTHEQTDQFVLEELPRTRKRFKKPEPDTFTGGQGAPQPTGITGDTVAARDTDWIWYPYFPAAELSLVGGKGAMGKGQSLASIVARITTGILWPDGSERTTRSRVIWCESEDAVDKTLIPRLIANRADVAMVRFYTPAEFARLDVKRAIQQDDARILILSPIMSFMRGLKSTIDEIAVRAELEKLHDAIADTQCALIGIAHLNKKTDLDAIERLLGSVAFANFVRSVALIGTDKEKANMRRWVHAKHNLSERGHDLLFQTVHAGKNPRDQYVRTDWTLPGDNVDIDTFFERRKASKPSAMNWLLAYLEEHGRSRATDVLNAAEQAGYVRDTVEKAQLRSPKIHSEKDGFPAEVWWRI